MQVNSFKAILAAVSVAAFASACTSKGGDKAAIAAAIKASACPAAGAAARLSPDQLQLSNEMQKFEPCFDVTKTFLTDKIAGITVESLAMKDAGTDSLNGTMQLKGNLVLRSSFSTYTFKSDGVSISELRAGTVFDVIVEDTSKKLESELGGLLTIKARCMDAGCQSISMWLASAQLGRSNTAGVIFTADQSSNYSIATSQKNSIVASERFNRSAGTIDGIESAPLEGPQKPAAFEPPVLFGP